MAATSEKNITSRKSIYFSGLHCADCALKIENEVSRINGVKSATLDFVSQKLTIDAEDKNKLQDIMNKAAEIALGIEPDIKIIDNVNPENTNYGNANDQDSKKVWIERAAFGLGTILFIVAIFIALPFWIRLIFYITSYLLMGSKVVIRALKNMLKGRVFDENFLMSIATIGAFAIGEYPEGVAVMLFYQIGEFFQNTAVNRSRKSIAALMDIRPDFANLMIGDELQRVSPEQVKIGDKIIVKPGEKIPLDGVVSEGSSTLDTSALTGESIFRKVDVGDTVLSGSINKNGVLTISVTKAFGESTVSKILDLVQNASSKKAVSENFITKFARYYTPFVVFAAVALAVIPPMVIEGASFSEWINRALVFLVVSCPCALVVSIPLSFFGGIGGASKSGILVKGGNFLEALTNPDTIVFDKTGTLTKGVFNVTRITSKSFISEEDLLKFAALAESYSNHPIALSIVNAYKKEIDKSKVSNYKEIPGKGISAKIEEKSILIGNAKLLEKENIPCEEVDTYGTVVHLAIEGNYSGYIVISDKIKPDSKKAINELKKLGVKNIVMLTGDSKSAGKKIGNELGIDEIYAELLPYEKVEKLEKLDSSRATSGKLVFVGDGINDAPVLARADVGVAMGGLGSDAAIEAADVVLMTDEPSKLVTAIKLARKTRNIVWQNIIFAMTVKGIILLLGAGGIATMWEAVFGDVGVALIAIINAMRVYK
ncbi:MAG TPA: heavy metal translocating P-type ATPase [Pseudobacteroides sp.]|nr:heavy metal translocating P-type ATPase [Pseudobacteroides sp.]